MYNVTLVVVKLRYITMVHWCSIAVQYCRTELSKVLRPSRHKIGHSETYIIAEKVCEIICKSLFDC